MTNFTFCPLPVDAGVSDEQRIARANAELNSLNRAIPELDEGIRNLSEESDGDISIIMDWAAQLRISGMDWREAIATAEIWYFG